MSDSRRFMAPDAACNTRLYRGPATAACPLREPTTQAMAAAVFMATWPARIKTGSTAPDLFIGFRGSGVRRRAGLPVRLLALRLQSDIDYRSDVVPAAGVRLRLVGCCYRQADPEEPEQGQHEGAEPFCLDTGGEVFARGQVPRTGEHPDSTRHRSNEALLGSQTRSRFGLGLVGTRRALQLARRRRSRNEAPRPSVVAIGHSFVGLECSGRADYFCRRRRLGDEPTGARRKALGLADRRLVPTGSARSLLDRPRSRHPMAGIGQQAIRPA